MTPALGPRDAWQPLPPSEWNRAAAGHLLRRAGWTAREEDISTALAAGLPATLDRLFPAAPLLLPCPVQVSRLQAEIPQYALKIRSLAGEERRTAAREERERADYVLRDLSIKWLTAAADPAQSAFSKWVLFLSDVYIVSFEKVRNPAFIYQHFDLLGRHALGPAPALTKAISRSPAMVIYLDLNQSQRAAPNENFARELFELFLLGEGNYTEADIKEAARAFTGYRAQPLAGGFRFQPFQHDGGAKTVFGQSGNFAGDDVIDLAYRQPAAARFLPGELARFYLSDAALPPEHLAALGAGWQAGGFQLRELARTFFGSRLFFAPEFRGNFIKSPVQFYLGLVQDLGLAVTPLPRYTVTPLRQMGQTLYQPPNVRGWIGGRAWINSGTFAARRQFVETLFAPLPEKDLNADELVDLVAARSNGLANFTAAGLPALAEWSAGSPDEASLRLAEKFLAVPVGADFRASLAKFLADSAPGEPRARRLARAAVTLFQSPEYQLC